MYIQICNLRSVATTRQPLRVKGKKRYVPKTPLHMFATGVQCYNNGQCTQIFSPKYLVKSGQNVVEGRLEPRARVKSQGQHGQLKAYMYDKLPSEGGKKLGWTFFYMQTIAGSLPKDKLQTVAKNVYITNLDHANEMFSAIMRAYGYTTEATMNKIRANKEAGICTTLAVNTVVRFEHKGQMINFNVKHIKIKDSWDNGRGPQFNFDKKMIEEYKQAVRLLA